LSSSPCLRYDPDEVRNELVVKGKFPRLTKNNG